MTARASLSMYLTITALILSIPVTAAARTIHVDADATGANDGTNWADAYNYLQDALADANASAEQAEILVAQGTYTPDRDSLHPAGTGDREAEFRLIGNITVKGGYAGFGQTEPNARDIELYKTILSGDLDGNDIDVSDPCDLFDQPNRAENSYHVVTAVETDGTGILDGFTVIGGNNNGDNVVRYGGAIYLYKPGPIVVNNCTFRQNSASNGYGGAICSWRSTLTLTGCEFIANSAQAGGGIWASDSETLVTDCVFRGNYAVAGGGGMYNSDYFILKTMTVADCEFTENSAQYGGAIFAEPGESFSITNCIIRRNKAERGGGLIVYAWYGYPITYDYPLMISDCEITENIAQSYGGGICSRVGFPTISHCIISGNYAGANGGGISIFGDTEPSDPRVTDCIITGNSAGLNGGGVYAYFNSSPILTNCMITANDAQQGGGMYIGVWTDPVLNNCTFSGNIARDYGGAIYSDGDEYDTITMTNSILWADTPEEVYHKGTDVARVFQEYNNIQGGWPGDANVGAEPCFAEFGYWDPNGTPGNPNDDSWVDGDYHLKSQVGRWDANEGRWVTDDVTSPCIDAGDPMMTIGPEPFPNGGIVNMGAYGGTVEASKSYFGEPPCETIVAGDINGDCEIDFRDFVIMALHWCEGQNP